MKLTETQLKILLNAREGKRIFYPVGRSQSGGWDRSAGSLRRRGLLNIDGTLTPAGRAALEAEQ